MRYGGGQTMIRRTFVAGLFAGAVLPAAASAADKRAMKARALIIANSYRVSRPELALANTVADGQLIEERLRALRFTSVDRVEEASEPALRQRLAAFRGSLRKDDVAIVYIAGHGVQINGENFLLLGDGSTFMSLISIVKALRNATENLVVMLDACRNRPFARLPEGMRLARAVAATRSANIATEITAVSEGSNLGGVKAFQIQGTGVKIVFATDPENVAYDAVDKSQKNSPFAQAMAARLAERRSLDDVISMVTGDVVAATEGDQSPWSQGSIGKPIFLAGPPLQKNPAKPPFQVPG